MADYSYSRTRYGIGESSDSITKFTSLAWFALVAPGFQFDDTEDAADEEKWQDAIAAKNVFIVNRIAEQESIKVEDGKYTTPRGQIIKLWPGMRGYRLMALLSKDMDEVLRTYSDLSWGIIYGDRENTIVANVTSDGKVGGFELATFFVEDQETPDDANPPKTPITIQELDPGEYDEQAVFIKPTSWRAATVLKPLKLVSLSCTTIDTLVVTATVKFVSTHKRDADGTAFEVPVVGLTEDSFQCKDSDGTAEVITVFAESTTTEGNYTITGTDWTTGSMQIIPFVDFTTDPTDPIKDQFESAVVALTAA